MIQRDGDQVFWVAGNRKEEPARHPGIVIGMIAMVLAIILMGATVKAEEHQWLPLRMVWADALNVRDEPSLEGSIILQLDRGRTVFVAEEMEGWCYVLQNPSKLPIGWVCGEYLK